MHLYFWENGYLEPLQYCAFYLYILQIGLGIQIYRGWLLGCFESCPFYTDDRFAGTMAESKRFDTKSTGCLEGLFNFLALNQRLQMPKMIAYQKHNEGSNNMLSKVLHISTSGFAFLVMLCPQDCLCHAFFPCYKLDLRLVGLFCSYLKADHSKGHQVSLFGHLIL